MGFEPWALFPSARGGHKWPCSGVTVRAHARVQGMERGESRYLDDLEIACLTALQDGETDEVAASRVGLSRRTFRRRVKDAMDKLGARSRFQAGYRLALLVTTERPRSVTEGRQSAHPGREHQEE